MWNKISVVGMPRPGDYSVLAYHVNGSVEMVHCDDLNWSAGLCLYTHWMELPSPPTAAECGAEPVQPTTPPAVNAAYPGTGPVVIGGTSGVA